MLQRDVDHARRVGRQPERIEVAAGAKPARRPQREMAVLVVHRVGHVRVLVVVLRQQHGRSEVDRLAPPPTQDLALHPDAPDERGVGRRLHRRDHLVDRQPDRRGRLRVERDPHRIAVQVAGRSLPVLSLPLIHVQPDDTAVGAREAGVDVDEGLRPVIAGGDVREAFDRVPDVGGADRDHGAGLQPLDGRREERRACRPRLLDRRALVVAAQRDVDPAGHWFVPGMGRDGDLDRRRGRRLRPTGRQRRQCGGCGGRGDGQRPDGT